jgi:hypothetical protein
MTDRGRSFNKRLRRNRKLKLKHLRLRQFFCSKSLCVFTNKHRHLLREFRRLYFFNHSTYLKINTEIQSLFLSWISFQATFRKNIMLPYPRLKSELNKQAARLYQTTWCNIPGDIILHSRRCGNLSSEHEVVIHVKTILSLVNQMSCSILIAWDVYRVEPFRK